MSSDGPEAADKKLVGPRLYRLLLPAHVLTCEVKLDLILGDTDPALAAFWENRCCKRADWNITCTTRIVVMQLDDNGPSPGPFTADGISPANRTLQGLVDLIASHGGPNYTWTTIDPIYATTGGQPGGNIRNAILYDPEFVHLLPATQGPGNATDSVEPTLDDGGHMILSHNPGLIDPTSYLWLESRRPLVAHFQHCGTGRTFVVVVCHLRAKFEGQLYGIRQPPFNGGLRDGPVSRDNLTMAGGRTEQGIRIRSWVDSVSAVDNAAEIIVAGDMNEFQSVGPLDDDVEGSLTNGPEGLVDLITTLPAEDRFSYTFQGNSEVLDHVLVRQRSANQTSYEEIHINAFMPHAQQASDHDPPIAKIDLSSSSLHVPGACSNL
ncbi:hypothetical protein WJX74_009299 [Apatococcus lobatus]|uniref:Endonuclease/exonuclease/phosphatase domain-containing protein n=1 Tax=Apatococcus lobatus TaxID=904363 RepID=A0AAW1QCM1_9CHLO